MTTDTAPSARVAIFDWLQRKYVQRQDDRQKALGLVYMEAETHDLAEEIERQVAPLDTEIARLQAQVAEAWSVHARAVESSGAAVAGHLSTIQDLRAQVDALAGALQAMMRADMRGHELADRLQFSTPGREILDKCRAALAAAGR